MYFIIREYIDTDDDGSTSTNYKVFSLQNEKDAIKELKNLKQDYPYAKIYLAKNIPFEAKIDIVIIQKD